eukprot:gb/GEZN01004081.1/.p1 GENE.gb/GEZN01004081.1/~~gb/GEZN01004081.1/.p1  ORF type:complete len:418 (-),score=66.21 gb/GEZN01004081.1/:780-2033(-)
MQLDASRVNQQGKPVAVATGRQSDVVKGKIFSYPERIFNQKLDLADKLMSYSPLSKTPTVLRSLAAIVLPDGTDIQAYIYYLPPNPVITALQAKPFTLNYSLPRPIVRADFVRDLDDSVKRTTEERRVSILDATWFMPNEKQNAEQNYAEKGHLPRAVFFDLDKASDQKTKLPHMLPSSMEFSRTMSSLGVTNTDRIIVYDTKGMFSAPRVWWMLKVFGVKEVTVMDGGLPAYKGLSPAPLELGAISPRVRTFKGELNKEMVISLKELMEMYRQDQLKSVQIVDARSEGRFLGTEAEPRPGLRGGHIPGSISVPFTCLLQQQNPHNTSQQYPATSTPSFLKPAAELRKEFQRRGVNLDGSVPIITTCGSGVTAAVLSLALHVLGVRNTKLYDGSWSEWGAQKDTPVASATNPNGPYF